MAVEAVNLEQTDFSGGLVTDANPFSFPESATIDEANFHIEKDGSRKRRPGLEFDTDSVGELIEPSSEFYSEPLVTSKTYSTISPNSQIETTYTTRKLDVLTLTDNRNNALGGDIKSFDAQDNSFSEIAHEVINGASPFLVTQHVTTQAYTSVESNEYILSLIYGWDQGTNTLGVTSGHTLLYSSTVGTAPQTDIPILQAEAKMSDILSWSGRMVYCFNVPDDSAGYGIGISALPDPTDTADDQAALLCQCQQVSSGDLLGTDGAWIYAGDLGKIIKVEPFRTGLIFFTSENIWYLSAPEGYFDPYNFNFDKIATTRVTSKEAVVSVDKTIFFWAETGIYVIYPDENTGFPVLRNITDGRVEKFYTELLPETKENARGVFNGRRNEIRWLYDPDPTSFDQASRLRFGNELIYSLTRGVWTRNTFTNNEDTYVIDFVPDRAAKQSFDGAFVFDSTGQQVTAEISGVDENVYVEFLATYQLTSSFKYVVRDGSGAKVASLSSESFKDYVGSVGFPEGSDAKAYMLSGYYTLQDTQRKKQPIYLTTTFKRTETAFLEDFSGYVNPSSCLLTTRWDHADATYSGKNHGPYQMYRLKRVYMPENVEFDYGMDFVSTKNKVRGRGKTMQFLFESEEGKDCWLYAWGFTGKVLTRV